MQVNLSADAEARVRALADHAGKDASQVVEEAVDRWLEYEAHFAEAVAEGVVSAERDPLLDHEEVVERIERLFRS